MKLSDIKVKPRTIRADQVPELLRRIRTILAGHPELLWQVEDEFARFFCVRKRSKKTWERIDTTARLLNEGKSRNEIRDHFDEADPEGKAPGDSMVKDMWGRYKRDVSARALTLRSREHERVRHQENLRIWKELNDDTNDTEDTDEEESR